MSPVPSPVPVVLCGRRAAVGKQVAELLLPEYEVIHFLEEGTFEEAKSELTDVLAGKAPLSAHPNDVGTHDYSRPPRAVIFGRAFSLEQIQEVRDSVNGTAKDPVAWVVGDPATPPTGPPGPGYAESAAKSVKSAMAGWRNEGGVKDEIIFW